MMLTVLRRLALPFFAAGCLSLAWPPEHRTVVYMIGDSTMADKVVTAYPETGWGMPFHDYFDSSVLVDNRAMNGRSTKSFLAEGRWEAVMQTLAPGDYVLIQFGHNDEVPTKKNHTTPAEFRTNLARFVRDSRRKGAQPLLLTPIGRRKFDAAGQLLDTHHQYAELVRAVAREEQVPLIDLDRESRQLIQSMGPERSKDLFNYLDPGENPHYPEGRQDDTHFNEWGARRMAEIVLRDMASLRLPLAKKNKLRTFVTVIIRHRYIFAPVGHGAGISALTASSRHRHPPPKSYHGNVIGNDCVNKSPASLLFRGGIR